jgi:hypothetical protein
MSKKKIEQSEESTVSYETFLFNHYKLVHMPRLSVEIIIVIFRSLNIPVSAIVIELYKY